MGNADAQIALIHDLLDFSELVSADEHHPDYSMYRIEFPNKGIGFMISAKKMTGNIAQPYWVVRTHSTYNV